MPLLPELDQGDARYVPERQRPNRNLERLVDFDPQRIAPEHDIGLVGRSNDNGFEIRHGALRPEDGAEQSKEQGGPLAAISAVGLVGNGLLKLFPNCFVLDATHNPHIALIQRFVRMDDLDKVDAALH